MTQHHDRDKIEFLDKQAHVNPFVRAVRDALYGATARERASAAIRATEACGCDAPNGHVCQHVIRAGRSMAPSHVYDGIASACRYTGTPTTP